MENMKKFWEKSPLADKDAIVSGDKFRFAILTDRLIRMEYNEEGYFVDAATQTVICRKFEVPIYRVIDSGT